MGKPERKAVQETAKTDNGQTAPEAVMQVLKPETETEKKPEEQPEKPTVYDVIRKVHEKFYMSEQHGNFLQQLNKLHDFKSRINNNTSLRLTNGDGGNDFSSNDPAAVEALIDLCILNLKRRISDVENSILAA